MQRYKIAVQNEMDRYKHVVHQYVHSHKDIDERVLLIDMIVDLEIELDFYRITRFSFVNCVLASCELEIFL